MPEWGRPGGSPEPGGAPAVSAGDSREGHGRREIYGCEWTRVRARVRDVLLMGKKLRGRKQSCAEWTGGEICRDAVRG